MALVDEWREEGVSGAWSLPGGNLQQQRQQQRELATLTAHRIEADAAITSELLLSSTNTIRLPSLRSLPPLPLLLLLLLLLLRTR